MYKAIPASSPVFLSDYRFRVRVTLADETLAVNYHVMLSEERMKCNVIGIESSSKEDRKAQLRQKARKILSSC